MNTIFSPIQDSMSSRLRAQASRRLPSAVALAMLLAGATPAFAQDDDQPAWERIGEKLSPNSLEESNPEELPTVLLPEDEIQAGEYDPADYLDPESDAEFAAQEALDPEEAAAIDAEARAEAARIEAEATAESMDAPEGERRSGGQMDSRMDASKPGTIGLPQAGGQRSRGEANINLGKESDDVGSVINLFDDPEVRRMLGDNPRFIYGALQSPDPMIFPPVRNAAIYSELTQQADRLIKQNKLAEAQELYKRILDLDDKRYMLEMRNKIAQLNNRMGAARMVLDDEMILDVKLPQWVRVNTRGILYDETDPMVLVGDYTLHVGDPIPSHPEVRVESVGKRTVSYRVSDRESFNVAVKGLQ
jgi:hypothetical protein